MSAERIAVQLMIAQAALFAAETAVIHHLGAQISVMQLALIRGAAGVLLALVLARHRGLDVFRTRQLLLQLLRGGVALLYLWVMIYSFSHLPFADATAISYTQAAYIAVFSVLILREAVTRARWVAAAIGIVGAVLIAKPSFADWSSVYLVALLGTSLNGLSFVLNRYLQREDSEATTLLYTNLVPVIGNLPALGFGSIPAHDTLMWLGAISLLGPIGVYAGIAALRYAGAAMLGPYTLLRLVMALIGGMVIFGELPDFLSFAGASLILVSCMLSCGLFTAARVFVWSSHARGAFGAQEG